MRYAESVTFLTTVYHSKPAFEVPKLIARALGVKSRNPNSVSITRPTGELLYHGLARLTSDFEVCSGDAIKPLTQGEAIRVWITRPPKP
ncbi:hypothetical protein SBA1_750022 [Candidatus Sulfotelmatobacter kueseliae]|uniref:Uncharacterized protein n=1 Tax=Candidatus Sulfotelmatobacter kueseliae TaxID=2042962 RepID=A0A2U3L6N9_9BACT|nr:hypothetical protein SBA1_750022 [Candidatus Sulfotelmatobacter kueseliae]